MNDYLKTYQPLLYKTFGNALLNNNLSHAYLLDGESGTPLVEIAKYLAKSTICDNPAPFACDTCPACLRFEEGNYTDFYFFDGGETSIKKESVLTLEKAFSMTSVEKKGVLLYVMHNVENMTAEAINALLKFLEEPAGHVYAFLTTTNAAGVLGTIKSRSQILNVHLIKRSELLTLCRDLPLSQEDKELLIPFYNLPLLISEEAGSERYPVYKEALLDVLTAFSENPQKAYLVAHDKIPPLKERFIIKRVIVYFALFFKDVINYNIGHPLMFESFQSLIESLAKKINNPLQLVIKTYEISKKVDDNVNIPLLVDELLIMMIKDTKDE